MESTSGEEKLISKAEFAEEVLSKNNEFLLELCATSFYVFDGCLLTAEFLRLDWFYSGDSGVDI